MLISFGRASLSFETIEFLSDGIGLAAILKLVLDQNETKGNVPA